MPPGVVKERGVSPGAVAVRVSVCRSAPGPAGLLQHAQQVHFL